jgi:hypothetical protein
MDAVPVRVRNAGGGRADQGGFARHDVDAELRDRLELGMGGGIMWGHAVRWTCVGFSGVKLAHADDELGQELA